MIQDSLVKFLEEEYPNGGDIDIYMAGIGAIRDRLIITINAYSGVD